MTGKCHSKETKENMSSQRKGKNNANAKRWILTVNNNEIFYFITNEVMEYCKEISVSYKNLRIAEANGETYKGLKLKLQK